MTAQNNQALPPLHSRNRLHIIFGAILQRCVMSCLQGIDKIHSFTHQICMEWPLCPRSGGPLYPGSSTCSPGHRGKLDKCQMQGCVKQVWERKSRVCGKLNCGKGKDVSVIPLGSAEPKCSDQVQHFGADRLRASWANMHQGCPEGMLFWLQSL